MGEITAISIPLIHNHTLSLITIPILSGIVGYIINWTGVWMLYKPVYFRGVHVPGLLWLVRKMPRKIQDVPGLKEGGVGWQGIIPSRAGKMGSIAVDKQIAKIGTPSEFFDRLDPEEIAEHVLESSGDEMHAAVEEVMSREYPELWRDLPDSTRQAIHARVREELPEVVRGLTRSIGENVDELLDVKLMVVRLTEEKPELVNRLFHETGAPEFRTIIRLGFVFGFVFALPAIPLVALVPEWWVLPIASAFVGYATNWLGIWMIYEPLEPKKIGPFTIHGLFMRRQHDASADYADVIADEIITLRNITSELLHGPRSDRTRELIEDAMRPVVDRAAGGAGGVLRTAYGDEPFEAVRESVAVEAPDYTLEPFREPEFDRRQNEAVREMFTERMRELSSEDFSETMRSATREDEWMLVAHGAIFGIAGGVIHYLIFGV